MWYLQTRGVDEIPDEVVDELPADLVQQLKDGVLDRIPDDAYERLSDRAKDLLVDNAPDFVPAAVLEAIQNNPAFAAVLAVIGVIAVIGFFWGIAKSAIKAALFFAVAAAIAWYLFAQNV